MGWRFADLFSATSSTPDETAGGHVSSAPSAASHPGAASPTAPPAPTAAAASAAPSRAASRAGQRSNGRTTANAAPGATNSTTAYGINSNVHMSRLDAAAAAAAAAPLATAPGATPAVVVLAPPRSSLSAISPFPPSASAHSARADPPAVPPRLAPPDASPSADTFFSPRDSFGSTRGSSPSEASPRDHSAHGFSTRDHSTPYNHPSFGLRAGHSMTSFEPGGRESRREKRIPHDIFFLVLFVGCLVGTGYASVRIGLSRWSVPPPSNSSSSSSSSTTNNGAANKEHTTATFWPVLMVAAAVALIAGSLLLQLLFFYTNIAIKVVVHLLTTYIAVVSVFCFWDKEYFWGIFFAIGAVLQFVYAIAVVDRIAYTMLVVRRALGFARAFPMLILFAHVAALLLASWVALWTFGVSGIMAQDQAKLERWWILLLFAMSIFWTAAVVCNMVHVVTAGVMSSWFVASSGEQNASSAAAASAAEEGRDGVPVPPQQFRLAPGRVTLEATWHALIGLGSICYGSLFSPPIRVMRWMIRGVRARCIANECFFFIINLAFNFIEALTRAFNAFGFVTLAMYGRNFNRSSAAAWELFQSTGVEAVIAYDLSGAVLLMAVILAAMVAGTAAGVWGWFVAQELVVVVGAMGIVTGAGMAGVLLSVVEGAVTATYVTAAEDPTLIGCVDAEFAAQLADTLHQRLQHRSGKPLPANLASDGLPGGVPAA